MILNKDTRDMINVGTILKSYGLLEQVLSVNKTEYHHGKTGTLITTKILSVDNPKLDYLIGRVTYGSPLSGHYGMEILTVEDLWNEFDVPVDDDECIEDDWYCFKKGTNRVEVWSWFEENFNVSVHELMYGGEN